MSEKILIIEDDAAIAEYAAMVLSKEEYEVQQAPDGQSGLDKAREFQPDLVVLDLMMPGMHGYQVCQSLRGDKKLSKVRILITSTKCYDADQEGAKGAGADAYLTKPYTAEGLVAEVKKLLASRPTADKISGNGSTDVDQHTRVHTEEKPIAVKLKSGNSDVLIRYWGTRGSTPAPGRLTVRYGGNTSCTEMRFGDQIFVVDCGTGLREFGVSLLEEFGDEMIEGHLFVGHTHWDHIQGFPFFTPFYIPKNKFNLYSVRGAGKSLERVFRGQMAADYFPVPLKSLSSGLEFIELEAPINIGGVRVSYQHLNHPGVAIGFRFEYQGKVITYISDHETFSRLSGKSEMTLKQDKAIEDFARDSDLLICEAQYTEEEYEIKKGWGHSTFNDVVDRAIRTGSKHLSLFHHDPLHTDDMMDGFLEDCRKRIKKAGSSMVCTAAQEGQTINL